MAVVLDGKAMNPGDMVFDISSGRGQGTVLQADRFGIVVEFGSRQVSYSVSGVAMRATFRTLYHVPPIVVPLTGEVKRDTAVRTILEAVVHNVRETL